MGRLVVSASMRASDSASALRNSAMVRGLAMVGEATLYAMPSPNINFQRAIEVGLEDNAGNYAVDHVEGALEELGWAASADDAWTDLRVPLTAVKVGPAGIPGFAQWRDNGAGSTGVFAYHFDKSTVEQVYFDAQLPHSYKEGSELQPHLHYVLPSAPAAGETLRFGLEYTYSNVNGVFPETTIIYATETFTGDETANTQYIAGFDPDISDAGMKISAMLSCRLFRDAGNDTYDADAIVLEVDFHYQVDALGSTQVFVK